MEKRSFIPFDAETFLMIEDVTGTEPEVTEKENYFELKMYAPDKEERIIEAAIYAVQGRYGKRIKDVRTIKEQNLLRGAIFFVEYEKGAGNLPNELRTNLGMPDETAGDIYCRRLLEVRALPVKRDNWEKLQIFTGGGTMTIPRTPNGRAFYSFTDGNGIIIDAPETYYIVREPDGRLAILPEREFNREFEPKGVSVPKEPGDKGCGNCANFTNEDVNGNGYCEAFKCEQSCGAMPCQEYNLKINKAMNKREKFLKEIAEVINRNSLEAHFNDTPDFILAQVCIDAMAVFSEAIARRDEWHEFRKADEKSSQDAKHNYPDDCNICKDRIKCADFMRTQPIANLIQRFKTTTGKEEKTAIAGLLKQINADASGKPQNDIPEEVKEVAGKLAKVFGARVEIYRIEIPEKKRKFRKKPRKEQGNETR